MTPGNGVVNGMIGARWAGDNRAIYLPAVSAGFARTVYSGAFKSPLPFGMRDLDFLDPSNPLFHYPFALYSAGQHNTKAAPVRDIVSQRNRSATIVLGDSGGYQVSTTSGYFSPGIVLQNMRWMEAVTDYSMVLDFPTGGIDSGNMTEHVKRLLDEGVDLAALNRDNRLGLEYNACLEQTRQNNDAFVANRAPGVTKFLNVIQGRSEKESKVWYDAVKHYPFEGWALAGHHQNRFSLLLARLIDMRDDELLHKAEWIHVLGIGTAPMGMLLTQVQRTIREHYNPTIQLSYDTASASLSGGAFQRMFAGASIDKVAWTHQYLAPSTFDATHNGRNLGDVLTEFMAGGIDGRNPYVARTTATRLLTLGDLRQPGTANLTSDGKTILTHHNIEALLDANEAAIDAYFDDPMTRQLNPLEVAVPLKIIAAFIPVILTLPTAQAHAMIREHRTKLDVLRPAV